MPYFQNMKQHLFFIMIMLQLSQSISIAQELDKTLAIDFKNINLEDAKSQAKQSGKAIFMDVYAVWCIPCKQFEKTVFTDKEVGIKFNTSFINLKVDAEKPEGRIIAKKYSVGGYPTGIFINSEGELLAKFEGVLPKSNFMLYADNALKMLEDPHGYEKALSQYAADKQNLKSIQNLLHKGLLSGNQISPEAMDAYFASCSDADLISDTADLKKWVRSTPTIIAGKESYMYFLTKRAAVQNLLQLDANFLRSFFYNSLQTGIQHAAAEKNLNQLRFILKLNNELPIDLRQVENIDYELEYYMEIKDWELFLSKMNNYCHQTFDKLTAKAKYSNPTLAERINTFAWNYLLYAENKSDLAFAEQLMEKCIALDSTFAAWYDTYAAIVYKLGDTNKAILIETKAVSYAEKKAAEKAIYLTKIERMKRGDKIWLPEQY